MILFLTLAGSAWAQRIHPKARLMGPVLCKHIGEVFGPNPPCATALGLVETESAFDAGALSTAGAMGPGQFMPATARALAKKYPKQLGDMKPNDWVWTGKAIAILWKELMTSYLPTSASECSAALFTMSGYNGGPVALARERAMCQVAGGCDAGQWYSNVELQKSRAEWAFKENRDYVSKVITRGFKYANANMGRAFCQ